MLVNASREFRKGNPKIHLTDDAIARIAAAYLKGEPVDGLMAVIDSKQAEANDYNISPSRYISNGETKALREIPEIVQERAALKTEEAKMDADLEKVLAQLGVQARAPPQSHTAPTTAALPPKAGHQWFCPRASQ